MMRIQLTKFQLQSLGTAIYQGGSTPENFIRDYQDAEANDDASIVLIDRESGCEFTISDTSVGSRYRVKYGVPGLSSVKNLGSLFWPETLKQLTAWVDAVKRENESSDPWEDEADRMAEDDSYFTVNELPMVDNAVEKALEDLRTQAVNQGIENARIEAGILETQRILKKAARNSTKREWITLFKGIIVEKLLDWGMSTDLFQAVLKTLITSAHDIAMLTEQASRYLLP